MAMDQQHAESRQRFSAPATWWSGRVRAVFDLDRESDQRTHALEHRCHIGSACVCLLRFPAATRGRGSDVLPRDRGEARLPMPHRSRHRPGQRASDVRSYFVSSTSSHHTTTARFVCACSRSSGQTGAPRSSRSPRPRRAVRARADSETARSVERRRRPVFSTTPAPRLPGGVHSATRAATRHSPALRRPTSTARHTVPARDGQRRSAGLRRAPGARRRCCRGRCAIAPAASARSRSAVSERSVPPVSSRLRR